MSNEASNDHAKQMSLYEDTVYTIVEYISSTNPATLARGVRFDLAHFTIQWSQLDKYAWGRLREKITAYVPPRWSFAKFMRNFNRVQGEGYVERQLEFLQMTKFEFWESVEEDIFAKDVTLKRKRVLKNLHDHVLYEMETLRELKGLLRNQSVFIRVPTIKRIRKGLKMYNGWV